MSGSWFQSKHEPLHGLCSSGGVCAFEVHTESEGVRRFTPAGFFFRLKRSYALGR
jgi:hypothetical protein